MAGNNFDAQHEQSMRANNKVPFKTYQKQHLGSDEKCLNMYSETKYGVAEGVLDGAIEALLCSFISFGQNTTFQKEHLCNAV